MCPLTISQALIFSTCTLLCRALTFPQAGVCVLFTSLSSKPLLGSCQSQALLRLLTDTGCVPHLLPFLCGVEAKKSPLMRISLKPGRETAPGLSNNCADCANTILVQELLYSLCHLEGQNFYLGQSSGMPPHVFLNGEFCCVFRV